MIQFISDFKLPKEYSKKKKFDLLIGKFIPADSWKDQDTEIEWNINTDCEKVFLTMEECSKFALTEAINSGIDTKIINNGYIAIAMFNYSTTALNEIPLCRDPKNNFNAIDCEWNPEDFSFNFSFNGTKWEDLNITMLKVGSVEITDQDGIIKIASFNVYPVVDMTKM